MCFKYFGFSACIHSLRNQKKISRFAIIFSTRNWIGWRIIGIDNSFTSLMQ
jgi:hypothetical protein